MLMFCLCQVFGLWGCRMEAAGQQSPQVFGNVRHSEFSTLLWCGRKGLNNLVWSVENLFNYFIMLFFSQYCTDFVRRPGETLRQL